MKKISHIVAAIILLCLGSASDAQDPSHPYGANGGNPDNPPQSAMPSQLDILKSQYKGDVQAAIKPIQDRYIAALQALMKTLTQNADLDGALAVREELKSPGTTKPTAQGMPSQLDSLRLQYQRDTQPLVKPILDRYIGELRALVTTLTQNGNLNEAIAARQELKSVGAGETVSAPAGGLKPTLGLAVNGSRFAGTKWHNSNGAGGPGSSRIEFRQSGNYHEQWEGHDYSGPWKAVSDNEVSVVLKDGTKYQFVMNADGTELTRSDGVHWIPVK
jgi:hypothetical protein